MGLDIVPRFLFESSEMSFEKSKKISFDGICVMERPVNVFIHFALVESISDEPKTAGHEYFCALFEYCLRLSVSVFVQD